MARVAVELDEYLLEQQVVEQIRGSRHRIDEELSKVIVGQADVVEQLLISLFAGGHCLITGAPGLAKTLLVRSIAQIFHLKFQRIQFTPDLMPADITGTEILEQGGDGHRRMQFVKGPIFGNVILADEINRTPPKTQAALLEAMQEHQVTVAGTRYVLEEPFFVLATQNPIEMEGTYPLPEAQLDRFMFNVVIDYLPEDDEVAVVTQTTSRKPEPIDPLFTGDDVLRFHEVVRRVPIAEDVVRYAVRRAAASRAGLHRSPYHGFSVEFSEYRQYTVGDDPRYLDWRLLARSDRYYIKRFEDETNLRCYLIVDLSRSMGYGSGEWSKADYARTAAATLGYFLSSQRDAVGLVTLDERIAESLPARRRPGHLRRLMLSLERSVGGTSTDLSAPLEQIARTVRKRGLVVLL